MLSLFEIGDQQLKQTSDLILAIDLTVLEGEKIKERGEDILDESRLFLEKHQNYLKVHNIDPLLNVNRDFSPKGHAGNHRNNLIYYCYLGW